MPAGRLDMLAPPVLGRGVIVGPGAPVPGGWDSAERFVVDEAVLSDPAATVERLHLAWSQRRPVVVELTIDPARFRSPQSVRGEPWTHTPLTEPWFDRLHFLVWANNYDARTGEEVWWWTAKTLRALPGSAPAPAGAGDVSLSDGRIAWIDGGPRRPWSTADVPAEVIPAETVELGAPDVAPRPHPPTAELAPDQLAAVDHGGGAARVIAPAGSGKTRVLTERLLHLVGERGYAPSTVLAVAYNKQAQLELEHRTAAIAPHVRTLNALGLWVLTRHGGTAPAVIDEREVRRLVESILPGRWRRRANTDPIGPYIEALASVRLGLRDPAEVEASRDDVEGLGELFDPFRARLRDRRAVDFDEQVYAAIEVLLGDGEFRREIQRSCRHLLVDEFQDLTPAHVLLLRLLALPALDVFGVGDDDQCIYGHAGADPGFLINYGALFPGAAEHALRVNYRCAHDVVTGASTLLGYNHRRVPKDIVPGAGNDASPGALRIVEHPSAGAADCLVEVVREWLADAADGRSPTPPSQVAVLARVNSVLLAPHVALHAAGVPLQSVLSPDVLTRTGLRAALAYVRIAVAGDGFAAGDVVEILRRPTRGLPPWFAERIGRRRTWTVGLIAGIAAQVSGKDESKVLDLADDLATVVDAGRTGTTRDVLELVRDGIGLGTAMSLLDRTGGSQGSSHLDDLDGLLGVADLHPDPATFEPWLRDAFQREGDPQGVTLSTIHRVKGREWDCVAVFGVTEGLVPHRLAEDVEEERRVLHVAITRGRSRVAVLSDRARPSPFLAELAGIAPRQPPTAGSRSPAAARHAEGTTRRSSSARAGDPPAEPLTGASAAAEEALRRWRTARSRADGVPPYIVLNDRTLKAIAVARPTSARTLVQCDGIGPAKLERYGDEILAVLGTIGEGDDA